MPGAAAKVSVIIPAYNHEQWIVEALHSVVQQSLSDWELIIIDDASTDQTWQRIESFFRQHSQLTQPIICRRHTKNQGAPGTLNEALQLANGEFLAILNSDDVWHPERLKRLYQHATQNGYDFIISGLMLWDADSQDKADTEPYWLAWYQGLCEDWATYHDPMRTLLRGNAAITTSNFFWHHSVDQHLAGFAELRYVHDYEYLLRLLDAGFSVDCLWQEPLLYYRLHGCNTIREQPLAAIQENMGMLLDKLTDWQSILTPLRLSGLQIQLKDLYRYTGEEWLTRIHEALVSKEKELFSLIHDRDRWISERDQIISERDQLVQSQIQAIKTLEQQTEQLSLHIQQQQQWLADRDQWIQERDAWVADRDTWISERDHWIMERDDYIAALKQEKQDLLNSRSYRLGRFLLKPLQRIKPFVERVRLHYGKLRHV